MGLRSMPGVVHGVGALGDHHGRGGDAKQGVPDDAQGGVVVQRECLLGQALLQLVLGRCSLRNSQPQASCAPRSLLCVGMTSTSVGMSLLY